MAALKQRHFDLQVVIADLACYVRHDVWTIAACERQRDLHSCLNSLRAMYASQGICHTFQVALTVQLCQPSSYHVCATHPAQRKAVSLGKQGHHCSQGAAK